MIDHLTEAEQQLKIYEDKYMDKTIDGEVFLRIVELHLLADIARTLRDLCQIHEEKQ